MDHILSLIYSRFITRTERKRDENRFGGTCTYVYDAYIITQGRLPIERVWKRKNLKNYTGPTITGRYSPGADDRYVKIFDRQPVARNKYPYHVRCAHLVNPRTTRPLTGMKITIPPPTSTLTRTLGIWMIIIVYAAQPLENVKLIMSDETH